MTALTCVEAIRQAAERLFDVSDTARLDAELLMAHALGVSRSELLLRHMTAPSAEGFFALIERRMHHEPLAYITNNQEFYGLNLSVCRDVLIPRGDSEVLVDLALAACPKALSVLDCGTGSGALLLAVLANLPQATGLGIDRSAAALQVAQANARRLIGARAEMQERDWTQQGWADDLGQFDLILANPPYVENDADLNPSVRDYEPAEALFAGNDGLNDYRILIPQLPGLLVPGGIAFVEIGWTQATAVIGLANACGLEARLHHDLAGRPRVLQMHVSGQNSLGKGVGSA